MCDRMGLVKRVLAVEQKEEHIMDEYQELFKGLDVFQEKLASS